MRYIEVQWTDSAHLPDRWMDLDEAKGIAAQMLQIASVGIVIEEKQEYLLLARSLDDQGHASGVFQIPRGCILRIKELDAEQRQQP